MRILYLITDLGFGGAERFLVELAPYLSKNLNIECVIGYLGPPQNYDEKSTGIRIENLSYSPAKLLSGSWTPKFHQLVESFKPDIIHTNRFLSEIMTAEKIYNTIYVCHGHDNMVQLLRPSLKTLRNRTSLLNAIERWKLFRRKYTKVKTYYIANSIHTKEYLEKNIPKALVGDIRILPYPVDTGRFKEKAPSTRKRYRLVNVGSFQKKKNQAFLISSLLYLMDHGLDVHLDLVGDGALRENVMNTADMFGVRENVTFHGNISDVDRIMSEADIYVHSALYEPFGIVFIEAMSTGLPIVTLDGKGNRDILDHGVNGFMVTESAVDVFSKHIMNLLNDDSLYQKISRNAIATSKVYDIKNVANTYAKYYRGLLAVNKR